jgi:hypothetical protein
VSSSLCLKGAKVQGGGGENNNGHRLLSFFIFHRSDEGQNKRHEDNTKSLSLCLKGVKIGVTKAKKRRHKDDSYVSSSSCLKQTKNRRKRQRK